MKDDLPITDREILLLVRSDVQNLSRALSDFISEQKCCNHEMEIRVRNIEIGGSKEASEAIKRVEDVEGRVKKIETNCAREQAGSEALTAWYNTTFGQVGIIASLCLGIAGFILALLKFVGGP